MQRAIGSANPQLHVCIGSVADRRRDGHLTILRYSRKCAGMTKVPQAAEIASPKGVVDRNGPATLAAVYP